MPDWRKAQEILSPRLGLRPPPQSSISSRAWSVDASPFRSRLLSVARSPTVSGVLRSKTKSWYYAAWDARRIHAVVLYPT